MPGGWLGYAEITADSATWTTTIVDVSGLSQAVTVNTTRKVMIIVDLYLSGEGDAVTDVMIREGATTLRRRRFGYPTGAGQITAHFTHILNPSSGSHTYKVSCVRVTGAVAQKVVADTDGSVAGPSSITILDIGPAS